MNTDRHVGAWTGAAALAVLTVAALIPAGWLAADSWFFAGASWQATHSGELAAAHIAALMACCPVIGALLTSLASQLAREPVPAAHRALVLAAGTFVAATLLTTGEIVSYATHSGLLGVAGW